jgi:hypothetical protein
MICPACKREIAPTTHGKASKPEKANQSGQKQ